MCVDVTRKPRPKLQPPVCWACGKPSPKHSKISTIGWQVREIRIEHWTEREIYCPDCFAEWGWPEPMTARVA